MTIRFQKDKKRVIVEDKDIEGIPDSEWRTLMKRVLGRHYADLARHGPSWTFPVHSLPVFEEWVLSIDTTKNEQADDKDVSGYKFDIPDELKRYRDEWLSDDETSPSVKSP